MLLANQATAFSLLGPPAPWMLSSNNVIEPGDIGGPMDIGSGYRWNVPVVTYGFDQSFLDYFGSNGVAAVESAIKIINDLPPASQLNLADYPDDTTHFDYTATGLSDLKSKTLALLLEQLGLADSVRFSFVLKQWSAVFDPASSGSYSYQYEWPDWVFPDYIGTFNFDPVTLAPSYYVNETLYTAELISENAQNYVYAMAVDPLADSYNTVVSYDLPACGFYDGLTYDDVGGLAYLFSTNTVNFETLLPWVSGFGTNANAWVNGAWRPGIDKITFALHATDPSSGAFVRMTNHYADVYLTNGNLVRQQLQRVVCQPDFLFSVTDLFDGTFTSSSEEFVRTGTTNWINNSRLNGNLGGEGPGVIVPPVRITLAKTGRKIGSNDYYGSDSINAGLYFDPNSGMSGSFEGSSNPPVVYPVARTGTNQMITRMWLTVGNTPSQNQQCFTWAFTANYGAVFAFQSSTNLANWVPLFLATNDGSITTFYAYQFVSAQRFYRMIPQ